MTTAKKAPAKKAPAKKAPAAKAKEESTKERTTRAYVGPRNAPPEKAPVLVTTDEGSGEFATVELPAKSITIESGTFDHGGVEYAHRITIVTDEAIRAADLTEPAA